MLNKKNFFVISAGVVVYAGLLLGFLTPWGRTQNKIKLSLALWDVGYKQTFERATKLFAEEHPNVDISVEFSDWASYWQKLLTRVAAGNPPNICVHLEGSLREYAKKGQLVNLTNWFNRDIGWKNFQEKYWTGSFMECRYPYKYDPNEDIYALPWQMIGTGLYYNKSLFDETGLEYPYWYTTWDSFLTNAKKLTRPPDHWGFDSSSIDLHQSVVWVNASGGSYLNKTSTRCMLDTPEAMEALQFLYDLVHKHHVAPIPAFAPGIHPFMTGTYAMMIAGSWLCTGYKEITKFKWDIAPLPKGKFRVGGDPAAAPLVIFEGTKHQDISWEFLKFCLTPKVQRIVAEEGNLPIDKDISFSKSYLDPKIWPQGRMVFYWQLPWAYHNRYTERCFETDKIFTDRWSVILSGEEPLVETVKEIVREINKVLKDAVPTMLVE